MKNTFHRFLEIHSALFGGLILITIWQLHHQKYDSSVFNPWNPSFHPLKPTLSSDSVKFLEDKNWYQKCGIPRFWVEIRNFYLWFFWGGEKKKSFQNTKNPHVWSPNSKLQSLHQVFLSGPQWSVGENPISNRIRLKQGDTPMLRHPLSIPGGPHLPPRSADFSDANPLQSMRQKASFRSTDF